MIDVMYLGLGYCCGWYLNHMTSRGCSTIAPPSPTAGGPYPATVVTNLNNVWINSSLAYFSGATIVANGATAVPVAGVSDPSSGANNLQTMMVEATTAVKIYPFMTLPQMPLMNSFQIDGLTGPITFKYFDRVPLEENGLN